MYTFSQSCFRSLKVQKSLRTRDTARNLVGYSKNHSATTFVGKSDAILHKLLEIVALFRLLELEMLALFGLHPRFKLPNSFIHWTLFLASNLSRFASPIRVNSGESYQLPSNFK